MCPRFEYIAFKYKIEEGGGSVTKHPKRYSIVSQKKVSTALVFLILCRKVEWLLCRRLVRDSECCHPDCTTTVLPWYRTISRDWYPTCQFHRYYSAHTFLHFNFSKTPVVTFTPSLCQQSRNRSRSSRACLRIISSVGVGNETTTSDMPVCVSLLCHLIESNYIPWTFRRHYHQLSIPTPLHNIQTNGLRPPDLLYLTHALNLEGA